MKSCTYGLLPISVNISKPGENFVCAYRRLKRINYCCCGTRRCCKTEKDSLNSNFTLASELAHASFVQNKLETSLNGERSNAEDDEGNSDKDLDIEEKIRRIISDSKKLKETTPSKETVGLEEEDEERGKPGPALELILTILKRCGTYFLSLADLDQQVQ